MRNLPTVAVRVAVIGFLVAALAVTATVLVRHDASYRIDAQFQDAGQLVVGDQVQLGGRPIGSVQDITIAPNGLADIELKITEKRYQPLHEGTRAEIGSPGLSGVANRFVRIYPGDASMPEIQDGGVLDTAHTRGIVDLDTLIDGLDTPTRKRLQVIFREAADVFDGKAGAQANQAFAFLNPALSRTAALGSELVRDQAALKGLISSTAKVSGTLAQRRDTLGDAIGATAATLRDVASKRTDLQQALTRAPAVLDQATGVLKRTRTTLTAVDPTVRHLQPTAKPTATLLRKVGPVARDTTPALAQVRALLPQAQKRLDAFPATAKDAVPGLKSVSGALTQLLPITSGLRAYTPDLIAGLFEGFLGSTAGNYDANGHFVRVEIGGGLGSVTGLLPAPGATDSGGTLTGRTNLCPGGGTDPADDKSNPFVPDDVAQLCQTAPGGTP